MVEFFSVLLMYFLNVYHVFKQLRIIQTKEKPQTLHWEELKKKMQVEQEGSL